MKTVIIYYFSGTGNTEYVARLIDKELHDKGISVALLALDFIKDPIIEPYDTIILGFPVHGYGVPVPVREFIKRIPNSHSKNAVIFSTYGGYSAGAERWAAKLLLEKGFTTIDICGIKMPHNNPAGVDVKNQPIEKLVNKAKFRVKKLINNFITANEKVTTFSMGHAIIGSWLNPWAINKHIIDFSFSDKVYADQKCTHCLKCIKMCPTENIYIQNEKVTFGEKCSSCLRCFNNCPAQAIQTGVKTVKAPRYKGPLGDYKYPINTFG